MPTEGDFVQHQIEMLRAQGLLIDLVYCDLSIHNWSNIGGPQKISSQSKQGVDIVYSSWFWPRNTLWAMKKWRKRYVKRVESYIDQYGPPDVIHAHTYLGAWVGSVIKQKFNIPLIVTEHYTRVQDGTISQLHKQIAKEAYSSCNKVLAVSTSLADSMKSEYQVEACVFPNFIDLQLFSPQTTSNNTSNLFKIVCIGDLIPRKQIGLLIRAVQLLHHVELTIIGGGPEKIRLQSLTNDLNIEDRVTFAGQKSQIELSKILPTQHTLVHSSQLETFGLVLIEAMACGLPVISFDNGGASDLVTDTTGTIVMDQSPEALASAIKKMKEDYHTYDPTLIRNEIIKKYSPQLAASKLSKLYADIVQGNHPKLEHS